MTYRIINGTIIDGTGGAPRVGDICICDGLIVSEASCEEAVIIDARGLMVTPGFIDIHRHADLSALSDPEFGCAELAQGITTLIVGNCGLAPVPNTPQSREALLDYIEPCLGKMTEFTPSSFPEYMDALDKQALPLHIGCLCGTGAVTVAVKGFSNAPFDAQTLGEAQVLIEQAMDAGAFGISTGIMYAPECYTSREAFAAMASSAAKRGGMMTCHIRVEGDGLVEAVDEAIDIAAHAGIRLNISHFKATGVRNWRHTILTAIEHIERARAQGQDIAVDFYPYTCGATTLLSLLPPGIITGGVNAIALKMLGTLEGARKVLDMAAEKPAGWDDMESSIGWEHILVSSVDTSANARYEGLSIAAIAHDMGVANGWEAVCRLISEEQGKVGIILESMCEEDMERVAQLPYAMLISDALYGGGRNPHPRRYGAFPKFFTHFVREKKLLTVQEAVRKMTGMPAERIGLEKRGLLREGYYADVAIFHPDMFCDKAQYTASRKLGEGMRYVLVDGEVAWDGEQVIHRETHKLLRHKS